VCPRPRVPPAFKEERCEGGGRRNGIGYAQRLGNRSIIFASCAPSGRQPSRPPQRIVGGTDDVTLTHAGDAT
jgi:hypothetical protein